MPWRAFLLIAATTLTIVSGCRSAPVIDEDPLPFHVAIIPAVVRSTPDSGDRVEDVAFDLTLDGASLTRALATALGSTVVATTVLAPPEDLEAFLTGPPEEQDGFWISASRRARADLLLSTEIRYSPPVTNTLNGGFWLGLPLFLIGGPLCWFVPDNSYDTAVELRGSLYDLNPLYDDHVPRLERRAELDSWSSSFDGTDLAFTARGTTAAYFLSVLIPSGLLSRHTEPARHCMEAAVIQDLVAKTARRLQTRADQLMEARGLFSFFLEAPSVRVRRRSGGEVELEASVILARDFSVSRMQDFEILHDGTVVARGPLRERTRATELGSARESFFRYPIRARFPLAAGAGTLQLRLYDGSAERKARSFTFPLPSPDRHEPAPR